VRHSSCAKPTILCQTEIVQITLEIPDDLVSVLAPSGEDLSRAALEAFAVEAYRAGCMSGYQIRTLLGIRSGYELDGFLKERGIFDYTIDDFDRDLDGIRAVREQHYSPRPL
jgi:hypothetical protein